MLFRRFNQHLREQNWFAVAIDFIVVVVGIFIGLQVTDWNQARLDRVIESRYLQAVQADLNDNAGYIDESMANYHELSQNLEALAGFEPADAEALSPLEMDRFIVSLWDLSVLVFQMSAYEDMISSVGADIIGSPELRQGLSKLYASIDRYRKAEQDLNEVQYRNIDNYLADRFPMRRFSRAFARASGLPDVGDAELPDYAAFITSQDTQNRVTMKYMAVDNCSERLNSVRETLTQLQGMIEVRLDQLSPGG